MLQPRPEIEREDPVSLSESYKIGEELKNVKIPVPHFQKLETEQKKDRKVYLDSKEIYMIRGDSRRRGMKKLHAKLHIEKERTKNVKNSIKKKDSYVRLLLNYK